MCLNSMKPDEIQTFWAYWDPATVLAKLRG